MVFGLQSLNPLQRRIEQPDPRGPVGVASRGAPVYRGGSMAAHFGGGPQFGRPRTAPVEETSQPRQTPTARQPWQLGRSPQQNFQMPQFGWTHDPAYAQAQRALFGEQAQAALERRMGLRELGTQYESGQRYLSQEHQDALRELQDRLASQGIFRSGINIAEQGELGEDFGRARSEMARAYGGGQAALQQQYGQRMSDIQNRLAELDIQRAQQESQIRQQEAQALAEARAQERFAQEQQRLMNELRQALQPRPAPNGQYQPPQQQAPAPFVARAPNNKYWVISGGQRHELAGPGSGQFTGAVQMYGSPRDWTADFDRLAYGSPYLNLVGGPGMVEEITAGRREDPLTRRLFGR